MSDWWLEVDRLREQEAFRGLIPNGGCLVLVGDERAGHAGIARLLTTRARDFGYEPFGISRVKLETSVKRLLLSAWELVSPQPPDAVIRRWRVPGARLRISEVVEELAQTLLELDPRPALFFETPDRHDRLLPEEALAFPGLAEAARCPIVITSRSDAGTDWPREPRCRVRRLSDFSRDDILSLLMASPAMRGQSLDDLVGVAEMVTGGADTVAPDVAYVRLYALSRR